VLRFEYMGFGVLGNGRSLGSGIYPSSSNESTTIIRGNSIGGVFCYYGLSKKFFQDGQLELSQWRKP
jgi:hypothetical protein